MSEVYFKALRHELLHLHIYIAVVYERRCVSYTLKVGHKAFDERIKKIKNRKKWLNM